MNLRSNGPSDYRAVTEANVYGSSYYCNLRTSSFKQVACLILCWKRQKIRHSTGTGALSYPRARVQHFVCFGKLSAKNHVIVCLYQWQYIFTLKKVLWWVIFCKRSLGLLLYWQHRKGGGGCCTLLIFKWQGCDVHLWFQKDKNCPWIYEGEDRG